MKEPEEMTDAELRAACGIPLDCPEVVVTAMLRGDADRCCREGIEAVQATAREQATWNMHQREEVRRDSLRGLGQPVKAVRAQDHA